MEPVPILLRLGPPFSLAPGPSPQRVPKDMLHFKFIEADSEKEIRADPLNLKAIGHFQDPTGPAVWIEGHPTTRLAVPRPVIDFGPRPTNFID